MSAIIASRLANPAFFATCSISARILRDFLEADRVDLVGRQVGGGELADQPAVIFLALRKLGNADALAALALEIALIERGEIAVRLVDRPR